MFSCDQRVRPDFTLELELHREGVFSSWFGFLLVLNVLQSDVFLIPDRHPKHFPELSADVNSRLEPTYAGFPPIFSRRQIPILVDVREIFFDCGELLESPFEPVRSFLVLISSFYQIGTGLF